MPIDKPEDFRIDKEKAVKWAESARETWEKKLSATERDIFKNTRDKSFTNQLQNIDEYLSQKIFSGKLIQEKEKTVEIIDKAIQKSKINSEMFVYLKVEGENFGISNLRTQLSIDKKKLNDLAKLVRDYNISIDTYLKADLSVTSDTNIPIIIRLKLPKGSSLVPINADSIISDRDKTIKINNVSIVIIKGKEFVKLESEFVDRNDFKNNIEKAQNWTVQHYNNFFKAIPRSQFQNLQLLSNEQKFESIKNYLNRESKLRNTDVVQNAYIMSVDSILNNKSVPQTVTVYSGFSPADFKVNPKNRDFGIKENVEKFQNEWLGKTFISRSYIKGDLLSDNKIGDMNQTIIFRINVEKGSKGMLIPSAKEYNFVLPRDSEIIIKNIKQTQVNLVDEKGTETTINKLVIDANLIPKKITEITNVRKINVKIDSNLIERINSLKMRLPERMATSANFAHAKAEITGLNKSEYFSHSKANTLSDISYIRDKELNNISLKPQSPNFLTVNVDRNNDINTETAWNRNTDTEFKILEEIHRRLNGDKNATGTINLYTDLSPCASCSYVIDQFKDTYPKIKINVIYSRGMYNI